MTSVEIWCVALYEQTDDEAEKPKDRAEDLNDEYLDEPNPVSVYEVLHLGRMPYRVGSAASANAALLPLMPTETPHIKLQVPTVIPAQNNANPV